ncbi:glycosyltransferase family 2 protein [Alcaligenaceae bacterium LF4-65]|uniref:Glycosyltransferase family 2 protein n=1 Tax=Zwartia hollandica TaxID=324606 RepID=A0A953T7E6_9BURK|nr:glycosyltransferase family 2 protein [Zwartia hollandica]MBZ1350644.1 glycosyltransferase family 2 protein [Zwartia hollandica]
MGLSVIVITKNEAANIADCLASVAFADEIIVLDSGSTDGTVELARHAGAQVHQSSDWPGFGIQKNRVLALATKEWVFSIDADERVTPALRDEIIATLQAPKCSGYEVNRLSEFCGKPIRHSGWWPDPVLRLFRRDSGTFNDVLVHESVSLSQGKTGHLRSHLLHYPHPTLDSLIDKVNRYSGEAAKMMFAKGKRAGLPKIVAHSMWTFIRIYFLRLGILDGRHGFVLAVTAASGNFLRYSKLMFLAEAKDQSEQDKDRKP